MASSVFTPGLTTIPTKLLDEIAANLDRSSLFALSLVCKSGNISANHVLYRAYVNLEPPAKAPIHLFLRTICERPDLAAKVRRVNIRGWRSENEVAIGAPWRGMAIQSEQSASRKERKGPSYSNKDNSLRTTHAQRSSIFIEAAIKDGLITKLKQETMPALKKSAVWYTTLNEDADFVRLINRGVEDAHVLLMVGLLPNLRYLHIYGRSPYPLLDWYYFFSRSTIALRATRTLLIHGSVTKEAEPVVASTLQFLDIMPRLERLEIEGIAIKGHRFGNQRLPSKTLPRIVYLFLVPGYRQVDHVPGATFSIPDITKLLTTSKSTLTHLMLHPIYSPNEPTRLRDFKCLESIDTVHPGFLNIPPDYLDADAIANLLRTQILNTKIMLEKLAQVKAEGSLPALTFIRLQFYRSAPSLTYSFPMFGYAVGGATRLPLPDIEEQVGEELRSLFSKVGIKLELCQYD
ncbi:hypothetical protein J1614_000168 [Plenodomus biglobosus]|nr:hypothetical protein J1614_000168 [Plenodomus biglobosus]